MASGILTVPGTARFWCKNRGPFEGKQKFQVILAPHKRDAWYCLKIEGVRVSEFFSQLSVKLGVFFETVTKERELHYASDEVIVGAAF